MSAVALRPYLPSDVRRCAEIFRASIEELAAEDYNADQREAWAATADDEDAFGGRLADSPTLVAVIAGEAAAFASPKGAAPAATPYFSPQFSPPRPAAPPL